MTNLRPPNRRNRRRLPTRRPRPPSHRRRHASPSPSPSRKSARRAIPALPNADRSTPRSRRPRAPRRSSRRRSASAEPVEATVATPPSAPAAKAPAPPTRSTSTPTAVAVTVDSTAIVAPTAPAPEKAALTPAAQMLVGLMGWAGLNPFATDSPGSAAFSGVVPRTRVGGRPAQHRGTSGSRDGAGRADAGHQPDLRHGGELPTPTRTVQSVSVGSPAASNGAVTVAVNAVDA